MVDSVFNIQPQQTNWASSMGNWGSPSAGGITNPARLTAHDISSIMSGTKGALTDGLNNIAIPNFSNFSDQMKFAQAPDQSMFSSLSNFGNGLKGGASSMFDSMGGAAGIGSLLQGAGSLWEAKNAADQVDSANDLLDFKINSHVDNYGAQQSTLNTQMRDRAGSRLDRKGIVDQGTRYAAINEYMNTNGIKDSSVG